MADISKLTVDQTPLRQRLIFDRLDVEKTSFNLSDTQAQTFGIILITVGILDFLATAFLLAITYVTTSMEGMKRCDKLLVCNVLLPDVILELILLYFLGPAALANAWQKGQTDTVWLGFLHTASMFHPHLASATVCYMIALAKTDAYRYEMSNDMKHMTVLVLSTVAVTICFCSLPATEDKGYIFMENWLGPSFNISFEYGSIFMCLGFLGIVCFADGTSILRILEARKFFQENRAKVSKRLLEELDQDLVYCIISLVGACLIFPLIIGIPDATLMLAPRLLVYLLPIARVIALLNTCPHFHFAYFGQFDINDFDVLESLDEEPPEKVTKPPDVGGDDKSVLRSTAL